MGLNNIFSYEDFTDGDFTIELESDQLPLGSRLDKAGKCIICYCLDGHAEIEVNLSKHLFTQSEIIVIFPSQIVEQKHISHTFSVMYFTLAPHILQEVTFRFPPSFLNFLHSHFFYKVGEQAVREEQIRFNDLHRKFMDTQNICRREILMNLLRIYFLELYDKIRKVYAPTNKSKHNRKAELYEDFCNLVMRHFASNRDVSFYANALNISAKYLSVITLEHSTYGAKQWIDDYVILELKVRLRSTADSLQKISDTFNFPDLAFMSKYFKLRAGMSPSEYRLPARTARDGSGSLPTAGPLHERTRAGDQRKPRPRPVNAGPDEAT
jgi:AraC family transcriptional regulator, transcriptional activator of pobA